jgi:hypothetical protein
MNFAFVTNYTSSTSKNIEDYGKVTYTIKLLLVNGSTVTYDTNVDPTDYKGTLVIYAKIDNTTVAISPLAQTGIGEVNIKKDEKMIDGNSISDDIRIFNLVSNTVGQDCVVDVLKWSDMPYGVLQSGKIQYIYKSGVFDDVNLLVLHDVFDQNYKTAYVENVLQVKAGKAYSYTHTLLIDGKEYTCSAPTSYGVGNVVKVVFANNTISYISEPSTSYVNTATISAIDSKRVKLNGVIYRFKSNITIYYIDSTGIITMKGINDINTAKTYKSVSAYLDKPLNNNGKVEALVVNE